MAHVIAQERAKKGLDPTEISAEDILVRLRTRIAQEAEAILAEGIAASLEDIDVVMANGYGYPRWQGSVIGPQNT